MKKTLTLTFAMIANMAIAQISFTSQSVSSQGQYKMCVVDMNGDYLDDIVSVSTSSIHILFQNSEGDGFTAQSFTTTPAAFLPGWSIAAGDIDGNGYNDLLYGSGSGVTFMYANDDGTGYTQASTGEYVFSQRSNFIDINNDGHLDAFVCHDVAPNVFYINDGEGNLTFEQGGLGDYPSGGNYGSLWVDYNNDGLMDLHIAKCGGDAPRRTNHLFKNNGDGTFTDVAEEANLDSTSEQWSSAWGDFNNDGYMDVLNGKNAEMGGQGGHELMRNNGDGTFTDVTTGSGFDVFSGSSREHLAFDFNNDGYLDIFGNSNTIFINNGDMTFTPVTVPFSAAAIGDLNNDGFLDAYVGGSNTVYYNDGNDNNWIVITTEGVESNRNGIGARVELHSAMGMQIRDVRSGEGFALMHTLNTHFGIGQDTEIEKIVIKWPSGTVDVIENPEINTKIHVKEGDHPLNTEDQIAAFITLYPNPAQDQIHIASRVPVTGSQMVIYDISGRAVLADVLKSNSVDVSTLSSGLYFLNLNVEGHKIKLQFIKK